MMRLILTVLMLSLSACGLIEPRPSDIQTAHFGSSPNRDEALEIIKVHMSQRLFDPYSAVYECGYPRKAWANLLGNIRYGYAVSCSINAKNRFGAYVGAQPYNFIVNSGAVVLDGWARVVYLD